MKKRMKMTALILVCLLLPGISGCAAQQVEVQLPVSVRIYDSDGAVCSGYDFHYNEKNVLLRIVSVDGSGEPLQEYTVTSDKKGRILSVTAEEGTVESYTWTSKGQLLGQARGDASLRWEYNSAGRLLSTALTADGTSRIAYEYSEDGKPVSSAHYKNDTLISKTAFTCLEDGRLATETFTDEKDRLCATATYEYLEDGSIRVTAAKKLTVTSETLPLEGGGTVTRPITPYVKDINSFYTYDKAGFLVEESHEEDGQANLRCEYTYITVTVSENEADRVFPMCKTLPALGILDQLTF